MQIGSRAPRSPSPAGRDRVAPRAPRGRAFLSGVLRAIAALVLFFGALELALWAAGVEPLRYLDSDPPRARYWLPFDDGRRTPGFQRAWPRLVSHGDPEALPVFVRDKPANGLRVFVLGESTVAGYPYERGSFADWLQLRLTAMLPDRRVEVVNAGNSGWHAAEVEKLLEESLDHQADAVVLAVGHNEMVPRNIVRVRFAVEHPWLAALRSRVERTRVAALLQPWVASLSARFGIGPAPAFDRLERREESCFGDALPLVQERFRASVAASVAAARRAGVPILLATLPRNLRQPPAASVFSPALRDPRAPQRAPWEDLEREGAAALQRGDPEVALASFQSALSIDDEPARLHFALGQAYEQLGRLADARAAYVRALELDACPIRAAPWASAAVREVAAANGVPLIDLERLFDERGTGGIAGTELIVDNVHPNLRGHELIGDQVLAALERDLGLPLDHSRDPARDEARAELWHPRHGEFQARRAECNANLVLAVQSAERDANWQRAFDACNAAQRDNPRDWPIVAAVGMLETIAGNRARGRELIEQALQEDVWVRVRAVHLDRTEPPYHRLFASAGIDVGSVESGFGERERGFLRALAARGDAS